MKWIVQPEWFEEQLKETKLTSMEIPTISPPETEVTTLPTFCIRWIRQKNVLEMDRTRISVKVMANDAEMINNVALDGMEFFINEQGLLMSDVKITFSQIFGNTQQKGKRLIEVSPMYLSSEQIKQIKPLYQLVNTLIQRKIKQLNSHVAISAKRGTA